MNSVNITGRITKQPELKTKQDGGAYCYFCLAVDNGKDKSGQKLTEFIDCIAYNNQANFIGGYVNKGDMLELNGRIHTSIKEDSEGNKTKRVTVVAFNVGICSKSNRDTTAAPENEPAPAQDIKPVAVEPSGLPFEI